MKIDSGKGKVFVQHTMRESVDRTPPIRPRQQICPLLAGLNRMGCRGPHCQWWVPAEEDVEQGDCAMVVLALASQPRLTEELVGALSEKRRGTAAWHGRMGRMSVSPSELATDGVPEPTTLDPAPPPPTPDPEEWAPQSEASDPAQLEASEAGAGELEPASGSESSFRILKTRRGMSRAEVEALWGAPQEVRSENEQPCYIYALSGGGRVYVMFRNDAVTRVARW